MVRLLTGSTAAATRYKFEVVPAIAAAKAIAIVREHTAEDGRRVIESLVTAGMPALEVTCTTPGAFDLTDSLRDSAPLVGMGTVLSAAEAVDAAHVGARFIVTPNVSADVINTAHRHGLATIVGCGSATEIVSALELGADAIKVFPAEQLGTGFLKAIHGPLPWAPLIPVGGLDVDNAADWLVAGGIAVGIGSKLTSGLIEKNVAALLANIS